MKTAILIARLTPYGAERAAIRLAEGFKKKGIDVTVIVTDTSPAVKVKNVTVIPLLRGSDLNPFQKFIYAPLQYIRLYRLMKREKIGVLISFMERANIFNLALPGRHRRILTIHTFIKRSLKERNIIVRTSTKILYTLFLHRAYQILCVSKALMDDFPNIFPVNSNKLAVMYNPCNIEQIQSLAQQPIETQFHKLFDGNVIIHAGRFTKDKGQWYLIRSFKKILETIPNVELVFLGDGKLRGYAESLAYALGLKDKVHFLGFQQNPFKFISRATVLSFPSLWEGFPVALVEALICGAAIVATDCKSGPRELLAPDTDFSQVAREIEQSKYGILVPPLDGEFKKADAPLTKEEEMLAEALLTLLQDDLLRQHYKQVGYQRTDKFRTDRIVEEWMSVLEKL
ncbi:MAG: glycosyltransferase [Planctomycetota bacterium]|nr:MAG: glycosyltransferase [Planctomycetota bacterium]